MQKNKGANYRTGDLGKEMSSCYPHRAKHHSAKGKCLTEIQNLDCCLNKTHFSLSSVWVVYFPVCPHSCPHCFRGSPAVAVPFLCLKALKRLLSALITSLFVGSVLDSESRSSPSNHRGDALSRVCAKWSWSADLNSSWVLLLGGLLIEEAIVEKEETCWKTQPSDSWWSYCAKQTTALPDFHTTHMYCIWKVDTLLGTLYTFDL